MQSHSTSNKPENKTFRSLLTTLVNDPTVKTILIGETHKISPTNASLLANLDVLKNSKRKVRIVTEFFTQYHDEALFRSLKEKSLQPLVGKLNSDELHRLNICEFTFYQALLLSGIEVYGAETIESNPYINKKAVWLEKEMVGKKDHVLLSEVFKFISSGERRIIPNKIFANHINELTDENTLTIFIGGAGHVVQSINYDTANECFFYQGTTYYYSDELDCGMQGYIKNSKSIYLTIGENSYQENYDYLEHDSRLGGKYDYLVETNITQLYQDTFDDCKSIDEKKNILIFYLLNLVQAYLEYKDWANRALLVDYKDIVSIFNKSIAESIAFEKLNAFITKLADTNPKLKKNSISEYISLFFFASSMKTIYNELVDAVTQDLSKLTTIQPNLSLGF